MYSEDYKVVGVTFRNDETGVSRQDLLGKLYDDYWTEDREDEVQIELRHEPDNPYDCNACAVWVIAPKECAGRIGFLSKDAAPAMVESLENHEVSSLEICKMGATRNAKVWLQVRVGYSDDDAGADLEDTDADLVEADDGRTFEF